MFFVRKQLSIDLSITRGTLLLPYRLLWACINKIKIKVYTVMLVIGCANGTSCITCAVFVILHVWQYVDLTNSPISVNRCGSSRFVHTLARTNNTAQWLCHIYETVYVLIQNRHFYSDSSTERYHWRLCTAVIYIRVQSKFEYTDLKYIKKPCVQVPFKFS